MYEIFPKSLKEFIEDTSIKLPRFQRKNVWNDSRKSLLGISIFKNYPIGVSIIWIQNNQKWLLDGRQRRNAITEIMNNPMKMYEWATTALHENRVDMHEGCYEYAVIEKIGYGISANVEERQWFKWDKEKSGYFEVEEPECVRHLTNFAIG